MDNPGVNPSPEVGCLPTRYIGRYDEDELKDFPTANLRDVLAR